MNVRGVRGRRIVRGGVLAAPPVAVTDARGHFSLECVTAGPARLVAVDGAAPPTDGLPPALARVENSVGFMVMAGILGELEEPVGDDALIGGISAAGGVYEGPARHISEIDDLFLIEPGDVLVAATTGEAFNAFIHLVGAIVTDHGSFASHAGIVAREMGFPAVVGTTNATSRIPAGARVRVDGNAGEVHVLS